MMSYNVYVTLLWYSRQHCGHMICSLKEISAAKETRTRVAGIQSHRALANHSIATSKKRHFWSNLLDYNKMLRIH